MKRVSFRMLYIATFLLLMILCGCGSGSETSLSGNLSSNKTTQTEKVKDEEKGSVSNSDKEDNEPDSNATFHMTQSGGTEVQPDYTIEYNENWEKISDTRYHYFDDGRLMRDVTYYDMIEVMPDYYFVSEYRDVKYDGEGQMVNEAISKYQYETEKVENGNKILCYSCNSDGTVELMYTEEINDDGSRIRTSWSNSTLVNTVYYDIHGNEEKIDRGEYNESGKLYDFFFNTYDEDDRLIRIELATLNNIEDYRYPNWIMEHEYYNNGKVEYSTNSNEDYVDKSISIVEDVRDEHGLVLCTIEYTYSFDSGLTETYKRCYKYENAYGEVVNGYDVALQNKYRDDDVTKYLAESKFLKQDSNNRN